MTATDKAAIVHAYRVAVEAKVDGWFTADELDLLIDEALEDAYEGLVDDPFDGLGAQTWARIDLQRNPPPMTRRRRIFVWVCIVGMVGCLTAMITLWAIHWDDPARRPAKETEMTDSKAEPVVCPKCGKPLLVDLVSVHVGIPLYHEKSGFRYDEGGCIKEDVEPQRCPCGFSFFLYATEDGFPDVQERK